MIKNIGGFVIILLLFFSINHLSAEKLGDLTRQSPISKSVTLNGKIGENHYFEPNVPNFSTGKLYKLEIINNSDSKHYFSSSNFPNQFLKKIQILKNGKNFKIKG